MHKRIIAAGALALVLSDGAHAQQIDTDTAATKLDRLVVTAGREPVEKEKASRATTVITGEELEQRQVKTVTEALRQVPGLSISQTGGAGGTTAIRVRGAEANHVLVMIDGIETAGASDGFEFGDLTADQIERIEILRGPQSALWGAGATAGVINIITKGGFRGGHQIETFAEGGSNGSYAAGASVRGGTENADFALSASYRDEAGWDAAGKGGEKDGYKALVLNGKANIDLNEDLTLRLTGRFADRDLQFDETAFGCGTPSCYVFDADNRTTGQDIVLGASADYTMLGGQLMHTPSFSFASRSYDTTTELYGPSDSLATTLKAGHQMAYTFGPEDQHKLIGAVEFKRETFQNSYAGGDTKVRDQFGSVLEYRGNWTESLFVQLGARHDLNDDFSDATTWSASASYSIFETGTRLHASAGQGITNPTFFELYGFIPGTFVGNPNLMPEENIGFDIGIEQTLFDGTAVIDLTYFNETLTNEIAGTGTSVINLDGESDRQGVEVSLTLNPTPDLAIRGSYTYVDANEPDGTPEVRRPRHSAGLNVAYTFLEGRATVGTDVTYNGPFFDSDFSDPSFASPKIQMDDYFKVDVYGSYKVTENLDIYGRVVNLFDADYQEVLGFGTQPLTAYLGVKGRF